MTAERWRQIENIFAQAIDCPPPERAKLLDSLCGGDDGLRCEVESLLACDAPDQQLVRIPREFTPAGPLDDQSSPDLSGRRVGAYRLIRLIGRGGMGAVYLGRRDDDQYRKQVAIKLLKRGMDTDFLLSRFRLERQILANLEHPFIARLIDGGATEDGLPYFVMEYVDGVPITKYCVDHRLSISERLRLFRMVCEAVQHAHQNLVIHRDIKPGNILTTKEGVPKLLDFGIAKAFDPAIDSDVTLTQREYRMLTPDYASPEQIQGLAVSTATDTYSLGAVLYELLTGRRPHRFVSHSLADLENAVCVMEPLKPSSAVAENEDVPAGVRKQLKRQLAGDLDNIVLTALRKEPQRRYASAAEFAEDLRRHIEGRPVHAHVDRWTYRAGKFIRRNRLVMATAGLVAASLIAGIVATTIQARRAEQRFDIVRGLARTMLFDLYDQMERLPGSISLRVATIRTVVGYLDALAHSGSRDPELELEIASAYERVGLLEGNTFTSNLGHGTEAVSNFRKSIAMFERLAGRSGYRRQATRGLIEVHLRIAQMESLLGNPEQSAFHSKRVSEIASDAFARGRSEVSLNTQISVYSRLGGLAYERGESDTELENLRKALDLAKAWAAEERSVTANARMIDAYRSLGSAQGRAGDLFGALESFRAAETGAEELVRRNDRRPDHLFLIIGIHTSAGDVLAAPDDPNMNDRAAALARYQKAAAIAEQVSAADPRDVNGLRLAAGCYWRLGMILADDHPAQAVEYCRKALQISEEVGAGDPRNIEYRYHASRACLWMGMAYHKLRKHQEAVESLTRAVEIQNSIAATSPERIWNLRVLSRTYAFLGATQRDAGNPDGALASLRKGLEVADRMLRRAPSSLSHQIDRADVLEEMGRYYATLARASGGDGRRQGELRLQARSCFEGSLAIWRQWVAHKVGSPYAERRENSAALALASVDVPNPVRERDVASK